MKELKRTVSVEVNGKKVDIRFFSDPEIIEQVKGYEKEHPGELDSVLCRQHCKLHGVCEKLKDPYHLSDNIYSFVDFCGSAGAGLDSRKFDEEGGSLSLEKLKEELKDNPALYTKLEESGLKSLNIVQILIMGGSDLYDDCALPCYEDVEPILEDLKMSEKDQIPM